MEVAFVVLTALPAETQAFLRRSSGYREFDWQSYQQSYFIQLPSRRGGVEGVVSQMPLIGPTQAAISVLELLHVLNTQSLIVAGIAGGFSESGVSLGDILLADSIVDISTQRIADYRRSLRTVTLEAASSLLRSATRLAAADDFRFRAEDGPPVRVHVGTVLSGDMLIGSRDIREAVLKAHPGSLGVEMEGAGVVHALRRLSLEEEVSCLLVKSVADLADQNKGIDSLHWTERSSMIAASFTCRLLEILY